MFTKKSRHNKILDGRRWNAIKHENIQKPYVSCNSMLTNKWIIVKVITKVGSKCSSNKTSLSRKNVVKLLLQNKIILIQDIINPY